MLFCHGAAFSMTTWQHVGVLDALAEVVCACVEINQCARPSFAASPI